MWHRQAEAVEGKSGPAGSGVHVERPGTAAHTLVAGVGRVDWNLLAERSFGMSETQSLGERPLHLTVCYETKSHMCMGAGIVY